MDDRCEGYIFINPTTCQHVYCVIIHLYRIFVSVQCVFVYLLQVFCSDLQTVLVVAEGSSCWSIQGCHWDYTWIRRFFYFIFFTIGSEGFFYFIYYLHLDQKVFLFYILFTFGSEGFFILYYLHLDEKVFCTNIFLPCITHYRWKMQR